MQVLSRLFHPQLYRDCTDMAASTTMDVDRNCIRGAPLRINKGSGRISKKSTGVASRPADRVYNTDPSSFRKLVQELTGLGIEPSAPLPPSQSEKPAFNGRLQKIAPPPLISSSSDAVREFQPDDSRKLSPLPLLSPGLLSPIAALTPMEWMPWSDDTAPSPASLAYMQLAQTLIDREAKFEELQEWNLRSPTPLHAERISRYGAAVSPRFPLSPTSCSLFNLPSPGGFAGFEFGAL